MTGTIPVYPQELEVLRDLLERAKAPQITYSESITKMRDQAERKTKEHVDNALSHLAELETRSPD